MKRLLVCFCLIGILATLFSGCGGPGGSKSQPGPQSIFENRSDAVYSPNGSVPFGSKAYSPDGKYYASEIAPQDEGNFGIYKRADNQLVIQFKVLAPNITNYLKGLAWSPDSLYLAIMYHGTDPLSKPGIYLYRALDGQEIRFIGAGEGSRGGYHFMVFNKGGDLILVSYMGDVVDASYPTGLGQTTDVTPPSLKVSLNRAVLPKAGGIIAVRADALDQESGVMKVWATWSCPAISYLLTFDLREGPGSTYDGVVTIKPNDDPNGQNLIYVVEVFAKDYIGNTSSAKASFVVLGK